MKSLLSRAVYWRLSIFKATAGMFLAGVLFAQDKFHTIAWSQMALDEKILFFLAIGALFLNHMIGFMDQSLTRLREGQNTETVTKSVEVKTTVDSPKPSP